MFNISSLMYVLFSKFTFLMVIHVNIVGFSSRKCVKKIWTSKGAYVIVEEYSIV